VLASDLSEQALQTAAAGIYSAEALAAVPEAWRSRYFMPQEAGQYSVTPELRKNVAFQKRNLLDPFDVKKPFQVIFCRNVMIYFDVRTKTELVRKFYDALIPGGYFFIGHSESLATLRHDFEYVRPSVYRKPYSI
jgi:chemotaxis protein methyltransferase CheR